jgi:hypothetical protein
MSINPWQAHSLYVDAERMEKFFNYELSANVDLCCVCVDKLSGHEEIHFRDLAGPAGGNFTLQRETRKKLLFHVCVELI